MDRKQVADLLRIVIEDAAGDGDDEFNQGVTIGTILGLTASLDTRTLLKLKLTMAQMRVNGEHPYGIIKKPVIQEILNSCAVGSPKE